MGADAELAAAAGSDAAFGRLVSRHQQGLRAFLRGLCGDHAEADDLAQEALLAAWAGIGRLKDRERFRAWLYGVAWRKAQTHFRSRARSACRDAQWLQAETAGAGDGLAPEDRIALARAMQALPEEQRAAVALCLGGGWSHSEASAALGLPLGTVKSHVTRGREKLLHALGEPDES